MFSCGQEQLEWQQSDGKVNTERKRRDSKTRLSATKSMSSPGATLSSTSSSSSSGKEIRKAKLSRSRSLSSQPTSSAPLNSDRPVKLKESSSTPGPGKTCMLPSNDDSVRTAHFTMATLSQTPSASSVPVLIRSNTTSLLDRTSTMDHRTSMKDHRTCVSLDHRTRTLEQRSKSIDQHSSGTKDMDSRKLSINRKSNSFSMQRLHKSKDKTLTTAMMKTLLPTVQQHCCVTADCCGFESLVHSMKWRIKKFILEEKDKLRLGLCGLGGD
ncbi:hypothetical protein LDENG_00217410 [Lucifuga dentata]|nr:hypothetical protein LDENG_00217410 [Lucifuga dentata]